MLLCNLHYYQYTNNNLLFHHIYVFLMMYVLTMQPVCCRQKKICSMHSYYRCDGPKLAISQHIFLLFPLHRMSRGKGAGVATTQHVGTNSS